MSEEMTPIGIDEPLPFECSPDVSCFNECCRDLNQFLTPYDILRLKKNLGITSGQFLKKYTSRHNGPESGLPIVTFKPNPASGHTCPFVKESGCSVYEDRPTSCRMYPIARAIVRSRQTGETAEHFALIQEPHCCGFAHKNGYAERTVNKSFSLPLKVGEWLDRQDVKLYNQMNDKMMDIISLKNRIIPGKLDGADSDKFYLACYDIDTFRAEMFENGLSKQQLPENDDAALLEFGLAWIKNELFGIPIHQE